MPMGRYEYMWLPLGITPDETNTQYNLNGITHNDKVCREFQKGMYALEPLGGNNSSKETEETCHPIWVPPCFPHFWAMDTG